MVRWPSNPGFLDDPLRWLLEAGAQPGVTSLSSAASDDNNSEQMQAVFGVDAVRTVLSDLATFGMPQSLADRHRLPPVVANLNSALFSMTGSRHREHQRLLATALGPAREASQRAAIGRAITYFSMELAIDADFRLMEQTRRLARLVALEVILDLDATHEQVGIEIQQLFEIRRVANATDALGADVRDLLVLQGQLVDSLLRDLITDRRGATVSRPGVLSELIDESAKHTTGLSEDELVAHANILFMASSEPIATALAWILLTLTRLPLLAAAIRRQLVGSPDQASPLLHGTVREVLRLVPPSALLMRVLQRDVVLAGNPLTAGRAVLISPFVEHRREGAFHRAASFRPARWQTERPGPFEFLPFGGGARACLGRRIALATLYQAVRAVLIRADVVLAAPQMIGWRLQVTLQPDPDPLLRLVPIRSAGPNRSALLTGPAADLLSVGE
ncbi:MAG TPA: cytochrome P450 [Microlunatus sp.]